MSARRPTALRQALRGDCHSHSDWSDGGSPIEEMVAAADRPGPRVPGAHRPLAAADRGPRADRRAAARAAGRGRRAERDAGPGRGRFRLLSGIEVDILADGTLDQDEDAAGRARRGGRARCTAASADDADAMTRRMLRAVAQPAPGHPRPLHRPQAGHRRRQGRPGPPRRQGPGRERSSTPRRSSAPAPSWQGGRGQLPARPARPAEAPAAPGLRGWAACSRSTPTRTRPASSTGSATAASGPRCAESRPTGWSTPGRPTASSSGPAVTSSRSTTGGAGARRLSTPCETATPTRTMIAPTGWYQVSFSCSTRTPMIVAAIGTR